MQIIQYIFSFGSPSNSYSNLPPLSLLALHNTSPGISTDRRTSSLASAFGSTNSVGGSAGGPKTRPPLSTIPSQDTDSDEAGAVRGSDSEDSVSIQGSAHPSSSGVSSSNGTVNFHLGGLVRSLLFNTEGLHYISLLYLCFI